MNASQRRRHALTWLLLGPLLVAGTVAMIALRPVSIAATIDAETPVVTP